MKSNTKESPRPATPHQRIQAFCELTGWSDKALRAKIATGVWLEGREFHRCPEGSIVVDIEGYNRWAQGERQAG